MHVKKNPSKFLVRESPPCSSNMVPMERDAPSLEPMVYSFIYIYRNPQKGAIPRNAGKTYSHRPRSLTRTEGLHTCTMGCSLVSQGDR
jgi:hypothetical protein